MTLTSDCSVFEKHLPIYNQTLYVKGMPSASDGPIGLPVWWILEQNPNAKNAITQNRNNTRTNSTQLRYSKHKS